MAEFVLKIFLIRKFLFSVSNFSFISVTHSQQICLNLILIFWGVWRTLEASMFAFKICWISCFYSKCFLRAHFINHSSLKTCNLIYYINNIFKSVKRILFTQLYPNVYLLLILVSWELKPLRWFPSSKISLHENFISFWSFSLKWVVFIVFLYWSANLWLFLSFG